MFIKPTTWNTVAGITSFTLSLRKMSAMWIWSMALGIYQVCHGKAKEITTAVTANWKCRHQQLLMMYDCGSHPISQGWDFNFYHVYLCSKGQGGTYKRGVWVRIRNRFQSKQAICESSVIFFSTNCPKLYGNQMHWCNLWKGKYDCNKLNDILDYWI